MSLGTPDPVESVENQATGLWGRLVSAVRSVGKPDTSSRETVQAPYIGFYDIDQRRAEARAKYGREIADLLEFL